VTVLPALEEARRLGVTTPVDRGTTPGAGRWGSRCSSAGWERKTVPAALREWWSTPLAQPRSSASLWRGSRAGWAPPRSAADGAAPRGRDRSRWAPAAGCGGCRGEGDDFGGVGWYRHRGGQVSQLAAAELTRGSVRGGQAYVEVGVGYVAGPRPGDADRVGVAIGRSRRPSRRGWVQVT
jgi:hypothetical protein